LVLLLHSADQKLHLLWLLLLDLQRPRYVDSTLPRSLPATSLLPSGFLATHVEIEEEEEEEDRGGGSNLWED
jgi:hypothetical protein